MISGSPSEAPKRSLLRRWIADPVTRQMTQGVTPEKIALTIAVGSALAIFPILGTTTTLCALAAVLLGLNQAIIQGVNGLCTVVYFPLIVAFVRFGDAITRTPPKGVNLPLMISLFTHHPGNFFRQFGITALHAILGWTVVASFWIPLVYLISVSPLRAAAQRIGNR